MRLIDADELKAKVEAKVEHRVNENDYEFGGNQALDYVADILIDEAPTIDAVQVVRCKDCRHANECLKSVQYTHNEQSTVTIGYTPIEWCSRGERKGGDDE